MSQHIPQVLVRCVGVDGQELGVKAVAVVCPQKLLEPLPVLGTVDGIAHAGGQKLHRVLPQLGDLIVAVIQIDGIAHTVNRVRGVIRSALPHETANFSIFLIRNSDADLAGGFAADGGVPFTGDGLDG